MLLDFVLNVSSNTLWMGKMKKQALENNVEMWRPMGICGPIWGWGKVIILIGRTWKCCIDFETSYFHTGRTTLASSYRLYIRIHTYVFRNPQHQTLYWNVPVKTHTEKVIRSCFCQSIFNYFNTLRNITTTNYALKCFLLLGHVSKNAMNVKGRVNSNCVKHFIPVLAWKKMR